MAIVPDVDRERLRQVATNFRTALRSKFGDGLMTSVPRLNLWQDDCDGWGIDIAAMGDGFPSVQIFLNRFLGGTGRRLWAGLYSPTETIIQEVIDSYPLPIGHAVTDEDCEDEPLRLTIPFTTDEVKYPHPESFKAAGLFYFGIYDLDGKPDDADFLARTVDFIRALPDFQDSSEIGLDFRALEGLTVEQRRLVYSRSAQLARLFIAKRVLDKMLVCDDCSFDPTTRLDGLTINPRSLLDVHHKDPLHLVGSGWNTLTDLALLCPICHRLRHAIMRAEPTAKNQARRSFDG